MSIRRIARERWGIKKHVTDVLYKAVAIPIATYGAVGWYERTKHSLVQKHLMAAQRALLLLFTKACRTTATVSLQVISGNAPLNLEIVRRGLVRVKRNVTTTWEQYYFRTQEIENINIKQESAKLDMEIASKWQHSWNTESRGRITYRFIPNVGFARQNVWFRPSRECVYIVTGYGPINSTLFKRGIVTEPGCPLCGIEETIDHMLFDCELYEDIRQNLTLVGKRTFYIETKEQFTLLNTFAKEIFNKRNTYLKH